MTNILYFQLFILMALVAAYEEFKFIYKVNGIDFIPYKEKTKADFYGKIEYGMYAMDLSWLYFFSYSVVLSIAILFFLISIKYSFVFLVFAIVVVGKTFLEFYIIFIVKAKEAYRKGLSFTFYLQRLTVAPVAIGKSVVIASADGSNVPLLSKEHYFTLDFYPEYKKNINSLYAQFGIQPLSFERYKELLPFVNEQRFFAKTEENEIIVSKRGASLEITKFVEGVNDVYRTMDMPIFFFSEWKKHKQMGMILERVVELFLVAAIGMAIAL